MLCFWTAKGGSGATVTAAALALLAARRGETLLVDLVGDLGLTLGVLECESVPPLSGWGVAGWLHAPHPPPDALIRMERPVMPGLSLLPFGAGPAGSTMGDDPGGAVPPESRRGGSSGSLGSSPPGGEAGQAGEAAEWVEPTEERVKVLAAVLAGEGRRVVVDVGLGLGGRRGWYGPLLDQATCSLLVTRACYVGLTRASRLRRPDGVVLIEEAGRALRPADVATSLGAPVVATLPADPSVARAVDAGLLARRLPKAFTALEALAEQGPERW